MGGKDARLLIVFVGRGRRTPSVPETVTLLLPLRDGVTPLAVTFEGVG